MSVESKDAQYLPIVTVSIDYNCNCSATDITSLTVGSDDLFSN